MWSGFENPRARKSARPRQSITSSRRKSPQPIFEELVVYCADDCGLNAELRRSSLPRRYPSALRSRYVARNVTGKYQRGRKEEKKTRTFSAGENSTIQTRAGAESRGEGEERRERAARRECGTVGYSGNSQTALGGPPRDVFIRLFSYARTVTSRTGQHDK